MSGSWDDVLILLENIAEEHGRTLTADATWVSDPGPYRGSLVVDGKGRFHKPEAGEDPGLHREQHCTCYSPPPNSPGS